MSRELDRRDPSVNNITPARQNTLRTLAADVSESLPGEHRVTIAGFDAATGNPSVIRSEAGPREDGNYIKRALEHVQNLGNRGVLGLEDTQAPEYNADPNVQSASSGAVAVHLQQNYKGIPIFQATQAVRFAPDGTLQETVGSTITVTDAPQIVPAISVQEAVRRAAEHVATPDADEQGAVDQFGESLAPSEIDLSDFSPQVIISFSEKPERTTVLAPGPFAEPIRASLIWFPVAGELRLGWETLITLPNHTGQYSTIVDAQSGEILYCHQRIHTIAARGSVYMVDGAGQREVIDFPRALADYPLTPPPDLPDGFPDTWVELDSTIGNCVYAHLGDNGPPSRGVMKNGVLTFNANDPKGDDQKVLNIFYLNCYIHDFFYMLGFRERDGNFQQNNFGREGAASDRVDARAHSGTVWGTANMYTPSDGSSPVMNMGLVSSTNRHTAFDSGVVFHEFTHGVTNRLVGGPMNVNALDADQSQGMGEGWGDYIACTINDTTVVGAWVVGRPGGLRKFPYDSNYPDDFGMLGTGRYNEPHNIGEIWCATLMEMNRRIGAALQDATRGKWLGVQLVVDALKLSPANPSFLDMRDAIVTALEHMRAANQLSPAQHRDVLNACWAAFAKFGMGPKARSNGATLRGITPDFEPPTIGQTQPPPQFDIHADSAPELAIPDNEPAGVSDSIGSEQAGSVKQVDIMVNIEHTYIGDLHVYLETPQGSRIVLHDQQGTNTHNLVKSYSSQNIPDLAAIQGEPIQGDWRLHVVDLASDDVGVLHRWSIDIIRAAALADSLEAQPADNFQMIRGIGKATEQRLHAAGISSYADLAALSTQQIVERLGLKGMAATNAERNDWSSQAKQLALQAAASQPASEPIQAAAPEPAPRRRHYATFLVELLLGEESEVRRTRVKHIQEGEQSTWAGWEDGRLVSFFVEHAALRQPDQFVGQVAMPTQPAGAVPGLEELLVDVGELEIDEVGAPAGEGSKLRAEMSFQVSGLAADQAKSQHAGYFVHVLAYMISTGDTIVLSATQRQLDSDTGTYTVSLDFAPPKVGHYQLLGTVVLSEYDAVGAAVGPKLRVIP